MTTIDTKSLMAIRAQILERNAVFARPPVAAEAQPGSFGNILSNAVAAVNEQQGKAGTLSAAYERGDTTDIAAVMLQRQKASIAFEAAMQGRNKLLSAYKDIMNMPV